MTKRTANRVDIHQDVTDRIIAALEAGRTNWELPWQVTGRDAARPTNVASGRPYRGINVVALWAAAMKHGYEHGIWGTYKQWADRGAQVRKGEKATRIVFFKDVTIREQDPETGEAVRKTVPMAKASAVFNIAQVDGWDVVPTETRESRVEPVEAAERFVAGTGAVIEHGGERAFYRASTDTIHMPAPSKFVGTATSGATEAYYGTLLHELTHWTGHETRCNRDLGKRFGEQAYAMEELVAELGSAFLSADLGISPQPREDHAGYIAEWLQVLRNDKRAIFTAASKAAQAADYLAAIPPWANAEEDVGEAAA